MALLIVAGIVVGALEGFHLGGTGPVGFVGILFSVVLVSVGILRAIPVAEGVFVLEAVVVSVVMPPMIERSLQFELIGVGIAIAFIVGVGVHRIVSRNEPSNRMRSG